MLSHIASTVYATAFSAVACCLPLSTLRINNRTFRVVKTLGEGGFSTVILAQDPRTGRMFAIKQIRCPSGEEETLQNALKEAELHRKFQGHPLVVKLLDVCVEQLMDGSRMVYLFFPYYKNGTLQDLIERTPPPPSTPLLTQQQLLRMIQQLCSALLALHEYRMPEVPALRDGAPPRIARPHTYHGDQQRLGFLLPPTDSPPSFNRGAGEDPDNPDSFELDDRESVASSSLDSTLAPYCHRDLNPRNILIADDGFTPVLADLGSAQRARVHIRTRGHALHEAELAAQHTSLAYRPPELYDPKVGSRLDERIDVWSLGCVVYALAYGGGSPFEQGSLAGGSIAMAVQNGRYAFPREDRYGEGVQNLIKMMLVVDSTQRPGIREVMRKVEQELIKSESRR